LWHTEPHTPPTHKRPGGCGAALGEAHLAAASRGRGAFAGFGDASREKLDARAMGELNPGGQYLAWPRTAQ
jgi:hypothetical protein